MLNTASDLLNAAFENDASPLWTSDDTLVLLNPRLPPAQREALLAAQAPMPFLPAHVWLTTSGSGGVKWVALSKQALLRSAEAVNAHLGSTAADRWALALPSFHVGGLGVLARGFLSGAPVARYADDRGEPRWNAPAFHAFLRNNRCTLTTLVPTQLHDLVQAGLQSPPALRALVVGGGALAPDLYGRARARGWPVLPSYGLSECCSQVATASLSSLAGDNAADNPPLVLLSHVEAQVGEEGRIALRSASLLTGYGLVEEGPGRVPRFADPKSASGWFVTEDRGRVDGDVLAMLGRTSDFVKIGGESVDVARLQRLWDTLSPPPNLMGETVLIAAPDTRLGAAIHLVAAASGPNAQAALEQAITRFNQQVLPFERVQHWHQVERLPRSPLGKLLRTDLLRLLGFGTSLN